MSWCGCPLASCSFTTTFSRPTRSWPSRTLAPWSCWTGRSTSSSCWPWSPELWSSSMTCKQPMPIWSRTSLTKTPATGPSAWMPLTSACWRTHGRHPSTPTWRSRCTQAAMASWQPLTMMLRMQRPTATWKLTSTRQHPRYFACATPCSPNEDASEALAYGPTSQPWMGRRTSTVGT